MEVKRTLSQLTNKINGGEKASRNNSKCYSKQNQKEIKLDRKLTLSRKHLSLERAHSSLGISYNSINLPKIETSGDVSTLRLNNYLEVCFTV
jgi:hypothetical protein